MNPINWVRIKSVAGILANVLMCGVIVFLVVLVYRLLWIYSE